MFLRVSDLKQFVYCPRIVFYAYLMPVEKKATYKMEHGKAAEEKIAVLEKRRKLKSYGLDRGNRRFGVWLQAPGIGLSGKIDMLIEVGGQRYPVDFKYTERPPQKNHLYQICGYALMLEELHGTGVDRGFVYLIPQKDVAVFALDTGLKDQCRRMVGEIREMIREERMPEATTRRRRCEECEYRNYCRDIW
jgi:CRISPR-associated exonuclease Cas4